MCRCCKLFSIMLLIVAYFLFQSEYSEAQQDFDSAAGAALPWNVPDGFAIERVVRHLFLPVNLTFVANPQPDADAPLYYITELYGKVKVVLRNGDVRVYADNLLNFSPTGNFPGSGEMGVSGIVVEPNSGDLFVTMVYDDNGIKNKVVRMHSIDGGRSAATMTTLLDGIPGPPQSHQIHQASIGPDGKLYVQIGDGFDGDAAQRDNDLRGKILRINLDGSIPADNPMPGSYVYAKGVRNPFGGAWRKADNLLYISDNGPAVNDRLVRVEPGGNYGWPMSLLPGAIHRWNPPVAPTAVAFCEGAGFPESYQGRLFVALSGPTYLSGQTTRGKRIEMFTLAPDGSVKAKSDFLTYTGEGRATVVGLTFGPDGLYFTDLYGENGFDDYGLTLANVYRVSYASATGVQPRDKPLPSGFSLAQNYPNPFNPTTRISYVLAKQEHVILKIYNRKGQELATLIEEEQAAGVHEIVFDAGGLASGVYVYTMQAGGLKESRKMLYIK